MSGEGPELGPMNRDIPPVKFECKSLRLECELHAWGDNLTEAFEQVAMSMFGYMTEIDYVEMEHEETIEAEGDDLDGLLFHFLDEWLFLFSAEPFFIPRKVQITSFDRENFRIKARGFGEMFDIAKHPQGSEVKAITYSNMQIYDKEGQHEVFVIIDI
ncbi:unnamed protein product [Cyprideis torosa]|uniref:Uncharacterized protein n=1 Tax=Cyprideis torosa TaxID=163714 RepID=A0A7R8WHX5_9CRUS|nr:unnamed protein product [Cyprideis torosa]CAG0893496.1 unnamed protein product [Cyprideis torosa]